MPKLPKNIGNLDGFITRSDSLANAGGNTILGACAEYCPVNNFLPDGVDNETLRTVMREHMNRCMSFFESYRDILSKCQVAYNLYYEARDSDSIENLRAVCREIRPTVHIFGFKPECRL